ncbi:hypothetical protein BH20ACI2_BH20ACI2_21380 [soil metagenome]
MKLLRQWIKSMVGKAKAANAKVGCVSRPIHRWVGVRSNDAVGSVHMLLKMMIVRRKARIQKKQLENERSARLVFER